MVKGLTMAGSSEGLVALAIAVAFAAGLNLSAVMVTLGLLAQGGVVALPGPIAVIGEWWVIAVAAGLLVVESFADKIPAFDLVWNALMLFIRVPAGALLAFVATDALSPELQMVATLAGGAVALAASGAKLALRSTVTASPEPFSNVGLSVLEDLVAIGLTWFAVEHPYAAAAIVLILVALTIVMIRWIVRAARTFFLGTTKPTAGTPPGEPPAPSAPAGR
jgi:hypothetical protein